jgi:hypothetical protein
VAELLLSAFFWLRRVRGEFMKRLALIILALNLVSCASYFKRKECEDTNWFQYGQDVAMSGRNLENDKFIGECRKVEAEIGESALDRGFKKGRASYCEPETAFATGKKGEPFASEMCDGGNLSSLRKRHSEGVREFCEPENGDPAGATGKPYKNVCPKNVEAKFLKEFNKGRKRYLAAEVVAREQQVADIENDIRGLNDDRAAKNSQIASLSQTSPTIVRTRTNDGFGRSRTTDQIQMGSANNDEATKMQREELQRDVSNLDWQIRNKRTEQSKVREEIRKLRSEMLAL